MSTIYYDSPVGILKITANHEAILEVSFVQEKAVEDGNIVTTQCKQQLQEYFTGTRKYFDIALETVGTPYQKKVWEALRKIPYGETRSYKEIAIMSGNPLASRAVGMANNRNPIAIIIPCHRVIGSSGKLVGYAGGLDKKIHLLELEKRALVEAQR